MDILDETYNLELLFYEDSQNIVYKKNDVKSTSLNKLLTSSFSNYLIPSNHIYDEDEEPKIDESILTLSKFKELNLNKVKEGILYYCTPVDILSKLDTNNREYLFQESESEFYNDLSIKVFLQRQNQLIDWIKDEQDKIETIKKNRKLDGIEYLQFSDTDKARLNMNEEIIETNNLLKNIQKTMKIFMKEKNVDILLNSLNEVISNIKLKNIDMLSIGYDMFILIETNLILLIGIIEKMFSKNEEVIKKFIEVFIEITNHIKSNRLLFILIQILNKYKNISEKIKIRENQQMISDESVNLKQMINSLKIKKTINIENLNDFLISKGYTINEKNFIDENDFWTVNNKEELFIFSHKNSEKNLFFFTINIREEDIIIDDSYEVINFGNICLSNNEDDLISQINISIRNDLIYICYLCNQVINSKEKKESFVFEFKLYYKIYSTSMILLKEGSIKLNDFEYLNSYLYSDKNYLYVISDKNNIFVLKKNYLMDKYYYNKFTVNSDNKDISIMEYRYHNCFNLNNLILLEKKSNNEDFLLVNFTKQNDKYILNIIDINKTKREKNKEMYIKYKISYSDNIFLFMKITHDTIYFTEPNFNLNEILYVGNQFLPFDNSSTDYLYDFNNNAYKQLLKVYSNFLNLYGNFDIIEEYAKNLLLYPHTLCFNINLNNFNFVIEQIKSKDVDIEIKMYYFIIVKQFICCLYNCNNLKDEQINKLNEYLKNFVLDIINNNKDDKIKIYVNKILKEIIFIASYFNEQNIVEIVNIKNIINGKNELTYKTKILLLDLLLSQPKTQQNTELFNLIFEFDKSFLCDILDDKNNKDTKNKILSSNYKLYKNIMNKTLVLMENDYNKDNNKKLRKELFSLIEKITKNIEQICKIYQNVEDTELCHLPIFFYSINFSFFYFILQKLIANNYFNRDTGILSSLYNILLVLDKLQINKNIDKIFDLNNLIEIKSSSVENEDNEEDNFNNVINFNSKQNIIFKTNLTNSKDLNKYVNINIIKNENKKSVQLNLNDAYDFIHYDIDGIEIKFNKRNNKYNQLILNVIPIKDEKEYLKYRNNENYRIINLLQKTILHYILFLFEKINEKINTFFKEQNVRSFYKLYQTEFFQTIYTKNITIDDTNNKEKEKNNENQENQENQDIEDKNKELINEIYDILDYKVEKIEISTKINNIYELCDKFISFFCKVDNNEKKDKISLETFYKKDEKTLQKILSYKDINLSDPAFKKLVEQFNSDISKKNRILSSIKLIEPINAMILKIFQIIIKYYNYNKKIFDLMENITINEDYKLLCSIYEECCQMKMVYNQEKIRFSDEKFEEQSQNYINTTMSKLDFIYKIIVPSYDESLKYDKSIVKNLIDLLKNQSFNPKDIIKYSEIQNLNCKIKVTELLIINNLLINLNEEDNLKFILYIINERYNKNSKSNNYSISMSLLDSIYGADFAQIEKVKNQFHLLIDIISDKYIINKNNYDKLSLSTKISLFQSLIWKYKGRDFNILPKIVKCFEDLKNYELNNNSNKNILFKLNHEKIYRINNYNLDTFYDKKFEIFKIIISQIFLKVKDNLNNNNINTDIKEANNDLNLIRKVSKIPDYKDIINLILSFLTSITKKNKYFNEIILFFYKNLINSKKLLDLIITSYSEVIIKIFDIIFDNNLTNDNQNINTKLILLKLLLQILENINNEDNNIYLADCCIQYDKTALNINEEFNPFEFLISKFNNLLNKEQNAFLKYYYFKILLFCLNKIDVKKSNIDTKNILNINLLFFFYNNLSQIESKFYLKNEYGDKFEEIALFCHLENNKVVKSGNLLCFIDSQSLFIDYLTNNDITYFNSNDFNYNIEQKENLEKIFVIMDESLDGKINKIKCIEERNINNITLINNKNNNNFYSNYLKNNSNYIYDNLINKLIENKLNYKGINYILKLIFNLLDYITIENAEAIIKYIFKYINDEKVIENEKEWQFCSLEYFINEMNLYKNFFDYSSFNILNEVKNEKDIEKEKNESKKNDKDEKKEVNIEAPLLLSNLFNYTITNNDICIEYKSNNKIKKNFSNILTKINELQDKEKNNNNSLLMTNLSFYKSHQINTFTKITDNSLLLIQNLSIDSDLINILDTNKSKIKSIITSEIKNNNEKEFKEFLSKITIPIYSVSQEFYNKLITFFVEGVGGKYIPSSEYKKELQSDIIPIYKPLMLLNSHKEKKVNDFYTSEDSFDLNMLFYGESEIIDDNKKNIKLLEFEKNIEANYKDIKFNLEKVYCLENIKLCYRILYELLSRENIMNKIKYDILNKNIGKVLEIFDSLCKEYYFNISKKFSSNYLQNLLKKYLQSLSANNNYSRKWIQSYMEMFVKLRNKKDYLDCKEFDKLLFLFRDFNNILLDEHIINICFDIINDIIEKSVIEKNSNKSDNKLLKNKKVFKDEFICYFLYEIMNEIYETIINKKQNSKVFIKCFIKNNLNNSIIKFVDEIINIKNYLKKNDDKNLITKGQTMLVQFGLKYLDICFYIFFKEKQFDLIDYWIKSNNDLFLFYSSYKILSTEKYYEGLDYKELLSIIAFISDSVKCFYENKNEKYGKEIKKFKMKKNTFNKLKLKNSDKYLNKTIINSFSFNALKSSKDNGVNYNKLAIFVYNRETEKYSLQDIIDTSDSSDIKQNLINYTQFFNNEDIYLVPLNNVDTSLYAFGNNFSHALGINGQLSKYYDKPTKCEGLPKSIWHISYGNNYCLALSEDDNQIYACGCNKGGGFNSVPRAVFTNETRINNIENNCEKNKNKFINFATGNCDSSLLFTENLELYGIGNNEKKIFGLNEKKLKYPTKLELNIYEKKNNKNKINEKINIGKIKSFYIGYYNSYIINEEGQLFGLGNNSSFQISGEEELETYTKWKNIPLPENCRRFVDCAVGEKYFICLIEDLNGNNKLYAQGNNEHYQCGILNNQVGEPIKTLTMCNNVNNLSFKKIYTRNNQSAAITEEGDLYIWGGTKFNNIGQEYKNPTLVLFDTDNNKKKEKNILEKKENTINIINEDISNEKQKTIVDEVAICSSHMLIIARQYENGAYIRKLFGYGDNSKGALGLPMTQKNNEINIKSIKEIPIFNDKNEKLIPIKLAIGENKSYILCVDENELIQEIKSSKNKDNSECNINISNIYIDNPAENLIDFYYSKNLSEFINLFRAITNKGISEFIDAIDEIKINLQEEKNKNMIIKYKTFYDYITKNESASDLYRIFVQNESTDKNINLNEKEELKSIFNYLIAKCRYITNDIFKYCSTNEKSEYKSFLQKAIGNNISYLSAEKRLEKFNELLSKLTLRRGTERRVEVDRFKANIFYNQFNEETKNQISDLEFNKTIFGQVYQSFGKTRGEEFLIQKGKRLFIVCLKNEYASDSGGPYHEVISGICQELQSDYLNMFIKTPNNKHEIGNMRDKYIPNPQANREINEKTFEFLGKIMASAVTSGEVLDLNLHPIVWRALLGNEINYFEYESIDYTFYNLIKNLEKELKYYEENKNINKEDFEEKYKLNFVIKNSNEADIELKPEGEKYSVTLDNLKEYISLSKKMRVNEFVNQIEYIKKGFNSVISSSIFQVLNWRQLEEMVCGKNKLDVRDLKNHTRYDGFNENEDIINWFWEWLEECNEHEQSLYLKFVSGRSRLPKLKNFNYEHVIVKNNINSEALPHSATCFFTLKLPLYKDKETLRKKLNYSIFNCDEIDGDH